MPSDAKERVVFYVRRYNPEHNRSPCWQDYTVEVGPGMTVLDCLHLIRETQDATLSWRFSCRMGVCGSCGMLINGSPMLACTTQVLEILTRKKVMTLAPMPNFEVIKDLVPDLMPLFEKHSSILPYIIRTDAAEMDRPTGEFNQSPDELEHYLQFTYCIKCGLCMAACPTVATDREYLGPMPLTQAYRYNTDSRDGGFEQRKKTVAAAHGAFRCHYGGECSNVCPKGVDPARAIQLMKRDLVLDYLKLKRRKSPCSVQGMPAGGKHRPEFPAAPPYTVARGRTEDLSEETLSPGN